MRYVCVVLALKNNVFAPVALRDTGGPGSPSVNVTGRGFVFHKHTRALMEDVEFGEVSDGSFTIEAQKDPTPVTEPTVILNRTATVLFDASWKKDEAKPKKRLERQMSRPDHRVTLSWSDLKVVAPGQGPSLVQRARGISTTNPDKVILKNG